MAPPGPIVVPEVMIRVGRITVLTTHSTRARGKSRGGFAAELRNNAIIGLPKWIGF